jgi:antirestriction protein
MTATDTEARIYVACLASYNNGTLHGAWIDANQDADEIRQDIVDQVLSTSPHPTPGITGVARDGSVYPHCSEEWAIHDYEGFGGLKLSEYESIDTVAELARLIAEHGGAYAAYVDAVGSDYATEDGFRDAYHGEHKSGEDYAEEFATECYDLAKMGNLANYIDWEKFARDMTYDGWHFIDAPGGHVYVFSNL